MLGIPRANTGRGQVQCIRSGCDVLEPAKLTGGIARRRWKARVAMGKREGEVRNSPASGFLWPGHTTWSASPSDIAERPNCIVTVLNFRTALSVRDSFGFTPSNNEVSLTTTS